MKTVFAKTCIMGKIFHQHVAARAPRRDGVEKYAGEIVCW